MIEVLTLVSKRGREMVEVEVSGVGVGRRLSDVTHACGTLHFRSTVRIYHLYFEWKAQFSRITYLIISVTYSNLQPKNTSGDETLWATIMLIGM